MHGSIGDDDAHDMSDDGGDPAHEDNGLSGPLGPADTYWGAQFTGIDLFALIRGDAPRTSDASGDTDPDERRGYTPIARQSTTDTSEFNHTSPLDGATDHDTPPADSLFTRRYRPERVSLPPISGGASTARDRAAQVPQPREDEFMQSRGHADDHFSAMLQRRRGEDERATGRRWPGNGLAYPGDPHEAMFFTQMGIALGEVEPRVLARESALRYVRASRVSGEDQLAPTDIYSIIYYGLGLSIRPLNCSGLPHVLAVYHRAMREIYLDWTLLLDAPSGPAVFDAAVWRRAVDGSQVARLLLAWAAAIHLADNYDLPLVLGFAPSAPGDAVAMGTAAAPTPDTMNRYRKAMEATATLLAPAERLWEQVAANRLRIHIGDPDWRARMRSEYGYAPMYGSNGPAPAIGTASTPTNDPVDQLLGMLAEGNNCPPLLVELQLDGDAARPEWHVWAQRLLREVPVLQMRYVASARMFSMAGAGAPAMSVQAQLAF